MSTKYVFRDTRSLVQYVSTRYIQGDVLDLGAGNAKYKTILLPYSSSYLALDISPHKNIDIVSDITHTPFPDSSFDTVLCTQVFEHTPRPWEAVIEIQRVLRSNGVCIITAPFLQASHADPNDYFRYTIAGLESFFNISEFEILESGSYGGLYSIIIDFLRMLFFNVYEKPKPYTWRLVRILIISGLLLDKLCNNEIIYMNSYVIARKK